MTQDPPPIWTAVAAELRTRLPAATYDVWVVPLRPLWVDGTTIGVVAPPELRDWISDRFGPTLDHAAQAVLGSTAAVALVDEQSTPPSTDRAVPAPAGLNPKFSFDQFVIGDTNRFAHAAALAVAELPGQAYNPLFIYGPPGVGKTHLLHSIGAYVEAYGNGLTVRYTTIERFTDDFVAAMRQGSEATKAAFKARYRRADVLLIDDVQFLASKLRTEEEFFHTFNELLEAGSQLVITSDRLPRDLDALEDRMRERFASGLVADIGPPDLASRLTVLRKRVAHDDIAVAEPGALAVIAERITANVRALEGALIRVVAYASLTDQPITAPLAEKVLDSLYGTAARSVPGAERLPTGRLQITVHRVQDLVCDSFGLSRDQLVSKSREARIAWPRQVAMYLAREHTQESLPAIGRAFGGRNHTTVMHAVRQTTSRIAADPSAYAAVQKLTAQLQGT